MPDTDGPQVACFSPFIPPEWVYVHGVRARRLSRSLGGRRPAVTEGRCTYTTGAVELADRFLGAGGAGVVFATSCDQMRRAAEVLAEDGGKAFVFNLPHTWETPHAVRCYRDELLRLGHFLESIGGRPAAEHELAAAMRRFDSARRDLLGRRGECGAAQFARQLLEFHAAGDGSVPAAATSTRPRGAPLAVVGGPLLDRDLWILEQIEAAGARVALNATDTGERTLPRLFDRRRLAGDPLGELVDAYFGHIPDVFRRPNSGLYRYLDRELRARDVRGVILVRPVWCDFWRAETERLGSWLPCPMTAIDLADDTDGRQRARTRIQALLEVLP